MTLSEALDDLESQADVPMFNPTALRALIQVARAAEGLLGNVALDWYVQQFAKDQAPQGYDSGSAALIHNLETSQRAGAEFERIRLALAELRRALGCGEG